MDLRAFNDTVGTIFDKTLNEYGFKLRRKKNEKHFCQRIYINGDKYIKIAGDIHPMDFPPHYNIVLGQGSIQWPDCDWNAIPIWLIKKEIDPKKRSNEYSLEILEDEKILNSLNHAKDELFDYGKEFLINDLKLFDKLRKEQNRDREPYKIFRQTENGGREMIIDEESKLLKEKYS